MLRLVLCSRQFAQARLRRPLCCAMVLMLAVLFGAWSGFAAEGAEPSASPASDAVLRQQLGEGLPTPIPLWPGKPPQFLENAPPETVDDDTHIKMVSLPTLSAYLPPAERGHGDGDHHLPGRRATGALDWKTHVVFAADYFVPKGVAVIGLKYRLRPAAHGQQLRHSGNCLARRETSCAVLCAAGPANGTWTRKKIGCRWLLGWRGIWR